MTSSYGNILVGFKAPSKVARQTNAALGHLEEFVLDDIRETPEFTEKQSYELCQLLRDMVKKDNSCPLDTAVSIVRIYEDYVQKNTSKDYQQLFSQFPGLKSEATEPNPATVTEENDSGMNLS